MATEASQPLKLSLVCSTDLAALAATSQYTFVRIAKTASSSHFNIGEAVPCLTGEFPVGVLQNNPSAQGRMCEVVVIGVTKLKAGGTITAGGPLGPLTASSLGVAGPVTVTGSTYTKTAVGQALGTADWASGDIMTALVSCALPGNAGT